MAKSVNVMTCSSSVLLPPEKVGGCDSFLRYLHTEDGERDTAKAGGKKGVSLNVRQSVVMWRTGAGRDDTFSLFVSEQTS